MGNLDRLDYKWIFFLSIILIALGVTFSATIKADIGSLGTVFIAVGGLFFIASMARKRREKEKTKRKKS